MAVRSRRGRGGRSAAAERRCYLDTSAYLCILLGEEGSDDLAADLAGAGLLSSVLLPLEATRTLVRLSRDALLSAEQLQHALARLERDLATMVLRDLTLDLCLGLALPVVSTPRSLDLAHLRTALWFHRQGPPLTRFVTVDRAQRLAAQELGLPV